MVKSLEGIVKRDDVVDTEMMTTVIVVVNKCVSLLSMQRFFATACPS
jgi:hypothetical protein